MKTENYIHYYRLLHACSVHVVPKVKIRPLEAIYTFTKSYVFEMTAEMHTSLLKFGQTVLLLGARNSKTVLTASINNSNTLVSLL